MEEFSPVLAQAQNLQAQIQGDITASGVGSKIQMAGNSADASLVESLMQQLQVANNETASARAEANKLRWGIPPFSKYVFHLLFEMRA